MWFGPVAKKPTTAQVAGLPYRIWIPVVSSNLAAVMFIPYDNRIAGDSNKLYIKFHGGAQYVYYNVRQQVWIDLMRAPSKGKFHWRKIRNVYSYQRIV